MSEIFAQLLVAGVALFMAIVCVPWLVEYVVMSRRGYWLDPMFSGRGHYNPTWRDKTDKKRPDIRARFQVM